MKRTIVAIAASISTLLTVSAFAGDEIPGGQQLAANAFELRVLNACQSKGANLPAAEQIALMKACSTAVAIQEKKCAIKIQIV